MKKLLITGILLLVTLLTFAKTTMCFGVKLGDTKGYEVMFKYAKSHGYTKVAKVNYVNNMSVYYWN